MGLGFHYQVTYILIGVVLGVVCCCQCLLQLNPWKTRDFVQSFALWNTCMSNYGIFSAAIASGG